VYYYVKIVDEISQPSKEKLEGDISVPSDIKEIES
jgi:hypothetical protein